MLEKGRIVRVQGPQALDNPADCDRLHDSVLPILHVEVMDDLSHLEQGRSVEAEAVDQHLEGARISVMTELPGVHVEGDVRFGRLLGEPERRIGIDEGPNEPGACHPIDAGTRSGHPTAAREAARTQGWRASAARRRPSAAHRQLQRRQRGTRLSSPWRSEEVHALDGREPVAQQPQRAARQTALRGTRARSIAGGEQSVDLALQHAVVLFARPSEDGLDVLAAADADGVGGEHCCVTTQGDDLAPNPFEVLAALLGVRQDINRAACRDGPDLLQATPGLHAGVRRTGWELVSKQQPTLTVHVTDVTSELIPEASGRWVSRSNPYLSR